MLLVRVPSTARVGLLADLSASLEDQDYLAAAAPRQELTGRGVAVADDLEAAGGAVGAPAEGELVAPDLVDCWPVLRRCGIRCLLCSGFLRLIRCWPGFFRCRRRWCGLRGRQDPWE